MSKKSKGYQKMIIILQTMFFMMQAVYSTLRTENFIEINFIRNQKSLSEIRRYQSDRKLFQSSIFFQNRIFKYSTGTVKEKNTEDKLLRIEMVQNPVHFEIILDLFDLRNINQSVNAKDLLEILLLVDFLVIERSDIKSILCKPLVKLGLKKKTFIGDLKTLLNKSYNYMRGVTILKECVVVILSFDGNLTKKISNRSIEIEFTFSKRTDSILQKNIEVDEIDRLKIRFPAEFPKKRKKLITISLLIEAFNFKKLSLYKLENTEKSVFLSFISDLRDINRLELYECKVSGHLKKILSMNKNLKIPELNLTKSLLELKDINTLGKMLYLKSLDLSECFLGEGDEKGFKSLKMLKLEYLNLSRTQFNTEDLISVGKIHTLKKLVMDNCNIGESQNKSIENIEMLKPDELDISYNNLDLEDLKALSKMKTIKKLKLESCQLGEKHGIPINSLASIELEELNLENNKLTLNDLNALGKIQTLKKLNLNHCGIGQGNNISISPLISLNLEYMELSSNRIGLRDLELIEKMTKLRILTITRYGHGEKAIKDLE